MLHFQEKIALAAPCTFLFFRKYLKGKQRRGVFDFKNSRSAKSRREHKIILFFPEVVGGTPSPSSKGGKDAGDPAARAVPPWHLPAGCAPLQCCKVPPHPCPWVPRLNAAPLPASVYQSARVRGRCVFQQKDARLDRWTPFCVVEETSMNRMFYACPAAFDFINIAQVEVRKSPNFYKFVFFLFSLSSFLVLPSLISRKIPAPLGWKRGGGACF